jgi:hemoglobin
MRNSGPPPTSSFYSTNLPTQAVTICYRFYETLSNRIGLLGSISVEEQHVYAAIGPDGFERLAASFYRQVPADDVLGPMYPAEDLDGAQQRLRDFLIFRFGGPQTYIEQRGHPRLRIRHAPFAIGQAARDRWLQLMTRALDEAALPEEPRQILQSFFESTTTFLKNRPGD